MTITPKSGKPNNVRQFEQYLQSKGAIPASLYPWEIKYVIETKAGMLNISIHRSDFTKTGQLRAGKVAAIYCRFESVERAAGCPQVDKNRLNHYSGKYNFHTSVQTGDTKNCWHYCLNLFSFELERILG